MTSCNPLNHSGAPLCSPPGLAPLFTPNYWPALSTAHAPPIPTARRVRSTRSTSPNLPRAAHACHRWLKNHYEPPRRLRTYVRKVVPHRSFRGISMDPPWAA